MWEYRAALAGTIAESVHDGDTVRLLIDLGFDARVVKWIRLSDVHAPELSQPGGQQTRAYVADWASRTVRSGGPWPIRVMTDLNTKANQITSFDRYVGRVWAMADLASLNEYVQAYLAEHPDWPGGKALARDA
jgi:endonuclease YncB( thermonuclease family)